MAATEDPTPTEPATGTGAPPRSLPALPPTFADDVATVQRVATHILARARFAASGRFGLRATADGIATPQFGDDEQTLRIAGATLLLERRTADGARTTHLHLDGATLAEVAAFAGVDLHAPFDVGQDTPPVGDTGAPLTLDPASATALWAWYGLGAHVLDTALADAPRDASVVQLWPEHFDLAVDLAVGATRANVGVSPGDAGHPSPYVYVGPWGADRPGEDAYWNAPFGAVADYETLAATPDPLAAAGAFVAHGLRLLEAG
ncbi:MAG: hypothetical protein R2699_12450 [Acidimicrobiales bacterium]